MDTRDKLYFVLLGIVIELAILAHIAFSAERFEFFSVTGDSVRLAWSANTEPDLAAYTLYAATNAGTHSVWSGTDTTARVLPPLATFWETARFWMTARDVSGNESAHSDTISTILCREGPRLVGDIDGNGRVNVIDKALYWLSAGSARGDLRFTERADLDGNGRVDVMDRGWINLNSGVQR